MFLSGQSSMFFAFFTVPCGPNVNADLDCKSQALTLRWEVVHNAEGFIVLISNSNQQMSYNTTELTLRINTVECGLDYSLRVMSFIGTCVSQPSVLSTGQSKRALG